jgi:hypothetical protein
MFFLTAYDDALIVRAANRDQEQAKAEKSFSPYWDGAPSKVRSWDMVKKTDRPPIRFTELACFIAQPFPVPRAGG